MQKHGGELGGGAALKKAYFVIFRHVQHAAQSRLGARDNVLKPGGTVAHLQHGLAGTAVFGQFGLRLL